MVMSIDPTKLAAIQQISQHIRGVIEANYIEGSVKVSLSSEVPEAAELIPSLIEQFSSALASQLSSFFAIKGKIINVGKPSAKEE